MNSAAIDHLVIAAAELETGRDWLRHRLGVEPQP
ncbi:MAG: VOC family protein, partial [Deltaproteobacteria bacterium]